MGATCVAAGPHPWNATGGCAYDFRLKRKLDPLIGAASVIASTLSTGKGSRFIFSAAYPPRSSPPPAGLPMGLASNNSLFRNPPKTRPQKPNNGADSPRKIDVSNTLLFGTRSRGSCRTAPALRIRVADPERVIVAKDGVLLFVVLLSRLPYYSRPELTRCRACPRKPSCGHDRLQGYLAQSQSVL